MNREGKAIPWMTQNQILVIISAKKREKKHSLVLLDMWIEIIKFLFICKGWDYQWEAINLVLGPTTICGCGCGCGCGWWCTYLIMGSIIWTFESLLTCNPGLSLESDSHHHTIQLTKSFCTSLITMDYRAPQWTQKVPYRKLVTNHRSSFL